MLNPAIKFLLLFSAMALLASCEMQSEVASPVAANPSDGAPDIRVLSDAEIYSGAGNGVPQKIIADMLYQALQALAEDRLMIPLDDNAYSRFKRVLADDSDNAIALQGLQDIVARYLQLSEASIYQGLFEEAKVMLDRASFIDASHPDIASVMAALQKEMKSNDLFFKLDYPQFVAHSVQAQTELADIARQARQHNAFFLITAPNDDLARWMVSIMREAVSGYRLRGNIELASRTSIRLRMPAVNP